MPKILKNGNKKSGYLTLSSRIKIREFDNLNGAYPAQHRLGDVDRKGNISLNPFDDQNTFTYGKSIKDNFMNSGIDEKTLIDKKKWVFSTGLKIRNEIIKKDKGQISLGKSLVFEGNNSIRFIRTKEKIRNPDIKIGLQQGPYNLTSNGLNLNKGSPTDTFKIQISTDNINWQTIKEYIPKNNIESFYGKEKIKQNIFVKNIFIGPNDFKDPGEDFYIRFAQESISNTLLATWAISEININISNQNINLGYQNILSQKSGLRRYNNLISTPHTSSNLIAKGVIKRGISDNMLQIDQKNENISFFDETKVFNTNNSFFSFGTDPKVYPNLSFPLKDKTIIHVDLTPKVEIPFGIRDKYNTDRDNQLNIYPMVYWNNYLKKWEEVGKDGLTIGTHIAGTDSHTLKDVINFNSESCVGFGPMPVAVMSASQFQSSGQWGSVKNSNGFVDVNLFNEDYLSAIARPIDTFDFPFGDRYHATSSQYIKAKDLGITKPFILEKCSLSFNSKFQLNWGRSSYHSPEKRSLFALKGTATDKPGSNARPSGDKTLDPLCLINTFFILRQSNTPLENLYFERNYSEVRYGTTYKKTVKITSGSRDLITYGQMTLITTGSNANDNGDVAHPNFIYDLLDLGLGRDLNIIDNSSADARPDAITGSYTMNFSCGISPKYEDMNSIIVSINDSNSNLKLGDTTPGRSLNLDSTNRALVNGTGPKINGTKLKLPGATQASETFSVTPPRRDTIKLDSPYIIFPEDNLIFGWQYPFPSNLASQPQDDSSPYDWEKNEEMTIFGKCGLKLIGSQLVNNNEYHETINQNLTSANLYQHVLGGEKITDQWQVELKFDHSGSYLDNHFNDNAKNSLNRIGQKVNSSVSGDAGTTGSFIRAINKNDQARVFIDSNISNGNFYVNSSYGTMNTNAKGINPKYYYNYKHFGYFSDIVRQSYDGKYKINFKKEEKENITSLSPVNIIFVKGEKVEGPDNRVYKRKEINELINDFNFQSSNINTNATSSLPFIDDNIPRNRNYFSGSFIAV